MTHAAPRWRTLDRVRDPVGRGGRRVGRSTGLVALLLWLGSTGCAYSIVSSGRIRDDAFQPVIERTMAVRGIYLGDPVDARAVSQAELARVLEQTLDAQWSREALRGYERGLVAMGLWPPEVDLRRQYVESYSRQVVGLYVPLTRTMYVVEDVEAPFAVRAVSAVTGRDLWVESTLTHEIVHLLQHEAYPELLDPSVLRLDQDDVDRAVQAALEGDALRYGYQAMGLDVASMPPEELRRSIEAELAASETLEQAPSLLRWTLAFPYIEGYRLSLVEGLGLLEAPPASTEQVLHAARRDEPFQVLALEAVRDALPARCAFVHANTLGELHLSVLFRDHAGEAGADAAIWQGWDGDRFLAADCDGTLEFLWITAWDSEEDAREFEEGYRTIRHGVARRAGLGGPPDTAREGREVVVWSPGLAQLAPRAGALARRARVSRVGELRRHFGLPERPPTAEPPAPADE